MILQVLFGVVSLGRLALTFALSVLRFVERQLRIVKMYITHHSVIFCGVFGTRGIIETVVKRSDRLRSFSIFLSGRIVSMFNSKRSCILLILLIPLY